MQDQKKLFYIKLIHTIVWLFFNGVLIYLFYALITDQINIWFWLGIGAIFVECLILIRNGWNCPISPLARKYTDSTLDNFDIFLPNLIAKYNIHIYSTLFGVLVLFYILKVVWK